MKLTIRIFALSLVVAGISAAAVAPKAAPALPSHLSATGSMPRPRPDGSVPMPTCHPLCIVPNGSAN